MRFILTENTFEQLGYIWDYRGMVGVVFDGVLTGMITYVLVAAILFFAGYGIYSFICNRITKKKKKY